jgi:hypothetical protein
VADSEERQKFEAWAEKRFAIVLRRRSPGARDYFAPLIQDCWEGWQEAYSEGMRAGEIARWIPVEERMPADSDEYLVIQEGYKGAIPADFRCGEFFTIRGYGYDSEIRELYGVTHWQPLPAAPEEKKP